MFAHYKYFIKNNYNVNKNNFNHDENNSNNNNYTNNNNMKKKYIPSSRCNVFENRYKNDTQNCESSNNRVSKTSLCNAIINMYGFW